MKVIALDPGVCTGYAIGIIMPGRPMGVLSGQFRWSEDAIYNWLKAEKPDIIVYERFDSRPTYNTVELFSRNLIGVIKLYADQEGCKVYTQMPAQALAGHYRDDKKLQKESVYKIANPHANDAMRHLLQWYMFGPGYKYQPNKEGFEALA